MIIFQHTANGRSLATVERRRKLHRLRTRLKTPNYVVWGWTECPSTVRGRQRCFVLRQHNIEE